MQSHGSDVSIDKKTGWLRNPGAHLQRAVCFFWAELSNMSSFYTQCVFFFCTLGWMGTWTNILYTFTILNIFFRWGYFLRAKIGYQRILFFFAGYLSLFEVTFVIPRRSIPGSLWGIHFLGGGPFSKSNLKLMSRMIQSMQHDRAKQKCNEHGSQHVTLLETAIWLLIYPIIESA